MCQIVGNLLVFAALGFFAPLRFAALASVRRILALGAGCSVLVEAAQYVLRLDRVSSVDDVLLNAAGAGLAALASRRWWRDTTRPRPLIVDLSRPRQRDAERRRGKLPSARDRGLDQEAAADDDDAIEELSGIAAADPSRLAPYQGPCSTSTCCGRRSCTGRRTPTWSAGSSSRSTAAGRRIELNDLLLILAHSAHPLAENALRRWSTQPASRRGRRCTSAR